MIAGGAVCLAAILLFFHQLLNTSNAQMTSLAMRPHGFSEEYILLRYLLTNYSKVARPVMRSNEAVLVLARLFPIKLLNMYEKNEVLEMTMRLQLTWRDRMLVWHAADFNNQSTVVIPGGQLWIPDLQIVNSVSDLYALLRDQKFDFKVHSDGSVWWHPTGNLVTRCELHLMYFPFDYQRCPIMLESAIYSHTQLNLTVRVDRAPVSLSMYAESGHWDLLKVTGQPRVLWVTNSTAFTRVEFWLYLGRKTTYFKMNIIFPCCMLSGLQMLTFFFPLESTERVPEATSILLSVIVFQTMIVDQLPRSSNSIPLLCIYVDMLTGISVLAVAEAVIVASLVSRKGLRTKAPKWAHGFLRFIYKWNSDSAQAHYGSRSRSSLAFLRNSIAFQTLFRSGTYNGSRRRKPGAPNKPTSSNTIVLDNVNAANLASPINENSPYILRKSQGSVSGRPALHHVQSCPAGPSLQPQTTVKFLPPGGGALDLMAEDMFNGNDGDRVSDTSSRRQAQVPDAPLADFDPESSIMMSSMLGSAYQSAFLPAMTASLPIPGNLETSFGADRFVDDASIDDSWQTSVIQRVPPAQPLGLKTPPKATDNFNGKNNAKQSAELSPLLAPRRINEKQSKSDTPTPSPNIAAHRHALASVAAAASAASTPRNSHLPAGRAASYASTVGEGARGNSQADLSLMLPGLPRAPCMRRSRPSLFIPAADSDDIILDWIYLARVLDAVMFLICLTVVIVVPVVLFGILPPTTVD